jgi:regulatory protein
MQTAKTFITKIECLSDERIKLHTSHGASFVFRARYLEGVAAETLCEGGEIGADVFERLLAASYAYLAEQKAFLLLNRGEQCEFLLRQKLLKKNFEPQACQKALDYLREQGLLDDSRFARAWLSERKGRKNEGRKRLEAELARRGIGREIIRAELDAFFRTHDETLILRAAYEKALRLKKSPRTIDRYLMRQGFSFAQIRRITQT